MAVFLRFEAKPAIFNILGESRDGLNFQKITAREARPGDLEDSVFCVNKLKNKPNERCLQLIVSAMDIVLCVSCVGIGVYCGGPHGQFRHHFHPPRNICHDFSLATGAVRLRSPPVPRQFSWQILRAWWYLWRNCPSGPPHSTPIPTQPTLSKITSTPPFHLQKHPGCT